MSYDLIPLALSEQETDHFRLIDATGDLVGSVAGASIASLHQGVDGILTGAIVMPGVAHTFRYLAGLFLNRGMAKREQQRLGLAYGLAAEEIKRRLDRGEQLRTAGFFDPDKTDRSSADEIAEAVLLAAQKEHEERKLPYIAKLLAFTAFQPQVDRGMANYLVKLASALTYRQYCLLEIANNRRGYNLQPSGLLNRSQRENASQVFAALAECYELYGLGLVKFVNQFGPVTKVEDMGVQDMALDTPMGAHLHLGMQLQEIGDKDVADIGRLLSAP